MKPLPAQNSSVIKTADSAIPSLPTALTIPAASYSKTNRRAGVCSAQRAYPWLLFTSTAVAAVFCLMYITKPVILASQGPLLDYVEKPVIAKPSPSDTSPHAKESSLMPSHDHLPGEKLTGQAAPAEPPAHAPAAFEQTNLRIQHVLTAEAPGGHLARIDLDVPVLYQSRGLRWTTAEVAEARALLARLSNYQEKSRLLRVEGAELLDSWNHLMERSIPGGALRADSPTLPANQQDAADAPRPVGLNTTDSVKIQASGK